MPTAPPGRGVNFTRTSAAGRSPHYGSTRPPHCHVTTAQIHYALDETGAES
jgi:hypothetical protein